MGSPGPIWNRLPMEWSRLPTRPDRGNIRWCSIVGAPRCGTTSIAHYLSGHPDICLSNVKEPHFFSRRDLRSMPSDALEHLLQNYIAHFFPELPEGATMLDGSVSYLYAPEQLARVAEIWPDSKFIIAVRNPLDMAPSLHQRHVFNGDENILDFERAWKLIGERRQGRCIPRSCIDPRLLDYEEIGRLGKHVRRFLSAVGAERCFVSVFDDLVADPAGHYARLLDFLELPPDPRTDFAPRRASAGVRIASLQRLLKRPPKVTWSLLASDADLYREGHALERKSAAAPGIRQLKSMRKRLLRWNRTNAPPRVMSDELRSAICTALREDVASLSDLLGRDLSGWLRHGESIGFAPDRPDHAAALSPTLNA